MLLGCALVSMLAVGFWIELRLAAQGQGAGGALAPMRLPFQGRLLTPAGDPVPDDAATVLFSLYESATGGSSVWSSGSVTLAVKKGGFVSALLGDAAHPLSGVDFRNAVYLGVKIDRPGDGVLLANEPEMLPRIPVVPPLYAHLAGQADNAALLGGHDWRSILVGGANDPISTRIRADKIEQTLVLPGTVVSYAGLVPPESTGWLPCDGREVSRVVYPELFAAIGTAHGNGNGATTFHLPDYRGRFLRGVDGGAARDPDRGSRAVAGPGGNPGDLVGSVQGDEFKSHTHSFNNVDIRYSVGFAQGPLSPPWLNNAETDNRLLINASGGSETRPVNAYVNWIIRY